MSVRLSSNANVLSATTGLPGTIYSYTMWVYGVTDRNSYSSFCDMPATTGASAATWQYAGFGADGTSIMFAHSPAVETAGFATTIGTWYRVGVVRNGTSLTLYRAAATGAIGTDTATVTSLTPAKLYIGGDSYSGEWLNGRIGAFKMWTAALTAVEIEAEFNSYAAQRTTNLLRCHTFQTNTTDTSGNGYALANNGTAPTFEADPPISTTTPISAADSVAIIDTAAVSVPVAAADSTTIIDSALVGIPTPAADGATVTETVSIAGALGVTNPVAVADTLGIAGTLTSSDSVALTDLAKVGPLATDTVGPITDAVTELVGNLGATQPVAITDGAAIETLFGDIVVALWGIHPTTGAAVPLPDIKGFTMSRERNGAGSISLNYPATGLNFDLLRNTLTNDRDLEVEIWSIGSTTQALRGYLQEASGDDVAEDGQWSFAGGFGELRVAEGEVFPQPIITTTTVTTTVKVDDTHYTVTKKTTVASSAGGPATTTTVTTTESEGSEGTTTESESTKGDIEFGAVTPGELANTLLNQAQTRGGLTGITRGFTDTHDSTGALWDGVITTSFSPGAQYDQVLGRLVDFGLAEWGVTWTGSAYRLDLWIPEGRGVDLTTGSRPIVLRRGRNLLDAPRKWSVRDAGTTLLAAGSEGVYADVTDADALARRGRRIERSASANNLSTLDALTGFAQNQLRIIATGQLEVNHGVGFLPGEPRPLLAFDIGDWVYSQSGVATERLRVVQWTLSVDADQNPSGTVTLNDTVTDALSRLQARLAALTSGDTVVGTSTGSGGQDTSVPLPPEVLSAGSIAFLDGTLGVRAAVTVAWDPPVVNTDGTVITDLDSFVVQFALASSPDVWNAGITVNSGTATSGTFTAPAGQTLTIRVAAVDRNGNTSIWSDPPYAHTTADDDVAPSIPSTPTVSEFLGTVRIAWDQLTVDAADMFVANLDFDHVEVHLSPASLFTPSDATLIGRLYGRGTYTVTDLPYGTTQYARLVAVDWSQNKSGPSGQGSATPAQVVSDDVFDGAIGSAKLADLAVTTAKINNLAVNTAQVGTLSVAKLISGTISADMLLTGSMKTATTGNRVEIDSAGVRLNNGTNVVVNLKTSDGSALVVGEFRTSLSGQRIVFNPGGALADTMNFYPSAAGDFARIMARTAPLDGTAAILIDGGAANGTGRGRVGAYKSEAFISYVSNDAGGDTTAGFSRTAVSCNSDNVVAWAQSQFLWSKYSGSSVVSASTLRLTFADGDTSSSQPVIGSPSAGTAVKFDGGFVLVTNSTGDSFAGIKANGFVVSSGQDTKTDIESLGASVDALAAVRAAKGRRYRYRSDVARHGGQARHRVGVLAEEMPDELVVSTPAADGPGMEKSLNLADWLGLVHAATGQHADETDTRFAEVLRRLDTLEGGGGSDQRG